MRFNNLPIIHQHLINNLRSHHISTTPMPVLTLKSKVRSVFLQALQFLGFQLKVVVHYKENYEADCDGVDNTRHLVPHPMRRQILLNHFFDRLPLTV